MSFGAKLRQLRKERNWSQGELGGALTGSTYIKKHQLVEMMGNGGHEAASAR